MRHSRLSIALILLPVLSGGCGTTLGTDQPAVDRLSPAVQRACAPVGNSDTVAAMLIHAESWHETGVSAQQYLDANIVSCQDGCQGNTGCWVQCSTCIAAIVDYVWR
jgi:hypothetical protein